MKLNDEFPMKSDFNKILIKLYSINSDSSFEDKIKILFELDAHATSSCSDLYEYIIELTNDNELKGSNINAFQLITDIDNDLPNDDYDRSWLRVLINRVNDDTVNVRRIIRDYKHFYSFEKHDDELKRLFQEYWYSHTLYKGYEIGEFASNCGIIIGNDGEFHDALDAYTKISEDDDWSLQDEMVEELHNLGEKIIDLCYSAANRKLSPVPVYHIIETSYRFDLFFGVPFKGLVDQFLSNQNHAFLSFRKIVNSFSTQPLSDDSYNYFFSILKNDIKISFFDKRDIINSFARLFFYHQMQLRSLKLVFENVFNAKKKIPSLFILDEIRSLIHYSLILIQNPPIFGLLEEPVQLNEYKSMLCNLFEYYMEFQNDFNQCIPTIDSSISSLMHLDKYKSDIKIKLVRKVLEDIKTKEDFNRFLTNPEEFSESQKSRFILNENEAKELKTNTNDLWVAYNHLSAENEKLQKKIESQDDIENTLKNLIKNQRTILEQSKTELDNLENFWFEKIKSIYKSFGCENESKMFNELFECIKDPKRDKRDMRGKIDGEFGTGQLYFSDIRYFVEILWETKLKNIFKPETKKGTIKDMFYRLKKCRNTLTHNYPKAEKEIAAHESISLIKKLDLYLS